MKQIAVQCTAAKPAHIISDVEHTPLMMILNEKWKKA